MVWTQKKRRYHQQVFYRKERKKDMETIYQIKQVYCE